MEMVKRGTINFHVRQNRVMSRPEDFSFLANGIAGFGGLNLFP
jgi:hypothetical protein